MGLVVLCAWAKYEFGSNSSILGVILHICSKTGLMIRWCEYYDKLPATKETIQSRMIISIDQIASVKMVTSNCNNSNHSMLV